MREVTPVDMSGKTACFRRDVIITAMDETGIPRLQPWECQLGIGIQQLSECRRAYALLLFFGEFFPVPLFSLELNKQASKKRRLKDMIVVGAEFFAKNVNQYMEASKREKVVIAHKNGTETVLYNPETAERK